MPDLYRYSHNFEPLLLEGRTATLKSSFIQGGEMNVRCLGVVALPEYYSDFGALTAATWDLDNQDTNLELDTMHFAQMRVRLIDDMRMRIKNPPSTAIWRSRTVDFYMPQFSLELPEFLLKFYWEASEFFYWEYNTPRFDFLSNLGLATSRVLFSGWKFAVEKISEPGAFPIWLDGWPRK